LEAVARGARAIERSTSIGWQPHVIDELCLLGSGVVIQNKGERLADPAPRLRDRAALSNGRRRLLDLSYPPAGLVSLISDCVLFHLFNHPFPRQGSSCRSMARSVPVLMSSPACAG